MKRTDEVEGGGRGASRAETLLFFPSSSSSSSPLPPSLSPPSFFSRGERSTPAGTPRSCHELLIISDDGDEHSRFLDLSSPIFKRNLSLGWSVVGNFEVIPNLSASDKFVTTTVTTTFVYIRNGYIKKKRNKRFLGEDVRVARRFVERHPVSGICARIEAHTTCTHTCPISNKGGHKGGRRWRATLGVAVSIIHRAVRM